MPILTPLTAQVLKNAHFVLQGTKANNYKVVRRDNGAAVKAQPQAVKDGYKIVGKTEALLQLKQ